MTHSIILDKQTGALRLDDGFEIGKNSRQEQVLAQLKSWGPTEQGFGNGWSAINVRDLKIAGHYFIMTFRFENLLLRSFDFVLSTKPYATSKDSWDNWSVEKEMKNKERFDEWLIGQVGSKRSFSWGAVGAWFDERSGGSSIILKYN